MKELVQERLGKMEDLEQRRLLKDMMSGVFLHLVEYQEEMIRKLEERVFEELENTEEKFDIHVSLSSREDYDPIHEFLYPVLPADAEPRQLDISGVASVVREGGELRLFSVFLELETERIQELLDSNVTFEGTLITDEGRYPLAIKLKRNVDYVTEIENLYHIFLQNGIPWKTIHHPYAYKFVDCILIGGEGEPSPHEEIREILVSLGDYEPYKRLDLIPLWNIERLELKNTGFPVPAMDRVNFEHVLSLRKTGTEHGYLIHAAAEDIRYVKRSAEELTIVTPLEKSGLWRVLKVTKPMTARLSRYTYPMVSNKRQDSFIGRYASKQAVSVRAKAEIARIVNSFEAARGLSLTGVRILPPERIATGRFVSESSNNSRGYRSVNASADRGGSMDDSKVSQGIRSVDMGNAEHEEGHRGLTRTYALNPFMSDNVRSEQGKQVMMLSFQRSEASLSVPYYLLSDLMSFLVSEVQMHFPEYKCEGEWT
ncbi:hypothetical protein [Paenibacillus massiliensis]|uniref:hypothetical protein n=1 Tax=Paenibacillus massiliensis TaxID=225917 RepID=UPI00036192D9|nr:hypothetical protein [Paenibacillus massiliensis]